MAPDRRFRLRAEDRAFVLRAMSRPPRRSGIAAYGELPVGYVKYLVLGGEGALPASLAIANKVGQAYGFLTDSAWVVDLEAGVEFLLSATVYVNADGIFNDDVYEYEELGLPFLAALGRAVLEMQRSRPRAHPAAVDEVRTLLGVD